MKKGSLKRIVKVKQFYTDFYYYHMEEKNLTKAAS